MFDLMQRSKPWRSPKYLAWVRSLPCANCGKPRNSDAHHLIGIAGMGVVGGKAADQFAVPLCDDIKCGCHTELHAGRIPLDTQWIWLAKTLERAFNEGILGAKDARINHL